MNDPIATSLRDYTRAAGGGLIIGLPLLYTQEVWFQGFTLPWWKILLLLAVAYAIDFGYNSVAGFRRERSNKDIAIDSLSTMGLGVVIAFVALVVLGVIGPGTSLREAAGKVALEAIPVAFGASVAATQLSGRKSSRAGKIGPFDRLVVGAGGALLFALNVAPTEEVVQLGVGAHSLLLVGIVVTSLLVTLALVFFADFGGRASKRGEDVLAQPWTETVTSYAMSLGVALLLLWAFGRTDGVGVAAIVGMTVTLGAVASVGAAVARLVVGGEHESGKK